MVAKLPFFPTPYPDELFYSVLCRYKLRSGNPASRTVIEELYGIRKSSSVMTPHYFERIASLIPAHTGLTAEYFIHNPLALS